MNILNTKEEALANAAKNNSSEQVSLVWPSYKETQNPEDEPKKRKSEHGEEKVKTVAECGSSIGKGTEIYVALIAARQGKMRTVLSKDQGELTNTNR